MFVYSSSPLSWKLFVLIRQATHKSPGTNFGDFYKKDKHFPDSSYFTVIHAIWGKKYYEYNLFSY